MSRALLYLGTVSWRNSLRRRLGDLKKPRHAVSTILFLGVIALVAVGQSLSGGRTGPSPEKTHDGLGLLLSVLLVTTLVNGSILRGVAFDAAEADYLLPAPFGRGALLAYKIASGYPRIFVTATVIQLVAGGFGLQNPWLGYAGTLLYFLLLANVAALAGLVASRVRRSVFTRLVGPLRVVSIVTLLCGLILVMPYFVEEGGFRGLTRDAASAPLTRAVFAPAFAAADLGTVMRWKDALTPLAILLTGVALSFAVALLAGSSLVEWPIADRSLLRSGFGAKSGTLRASAGLPRLAVFRGAGAILWKNLLAARRAWLRTVLRVVIFGGLIILPSARVKGGANPGEMIPLFVAMLPLFLGETLGYDFRRDLGQIADLKAFPAGPMAISAAQIGASSILCLLAQALTLSVSAALGYPPEIPMHLIVLGFPPLTFGLFALENLSTLRHPRSKGAGLIEFFVFGLLAILPAIFAFALALEISKDRTTALVPAIVVFAIEDVGLLWLTGRAFAKIDVSRDLPGAPVPVP